jgi:hypothetical protein
LYRGFAHPARSGHRAKSRGIGGGKQAMSYLEEVDSPTIEDWEKIHKKAWTDEMFREQLETHPEQTIRDFGKAHGKEYKKILSTQGWVRPDHPYKHPPKGIGVVDLEKAHHDHIHGCC